MVHVCTCSQIGYELRWSVKALPTINQRTECTEIEADYIYIHTNAHLIFESVQAILPAYWILLVILRKRLFILITRQAITLRLKQRVGHDWLNKYDNNYMYVVLRLLL